ncbi:uncharacterized protein BYT42DRAFT_557731 [Radiomyces spectabilis]|uniref:uncharacterized protein n=1 Tax=Radiomyces spectabilis TaxID=64574 RepID=UPI00221FD359|nr:uncharacterized protein BYT42DRAFT_557731 [Radiomyces spectabilis]KAI8391691.1 hypothetical protein BYT42DRAFT_557731 [Radiomyces spectabilis]
MVVCRFFQEGRCKFGSDCRFEHINPGAPGQWKSNSTPVTDKYNEASIRTNLKDERPLWQLSVYGPAKEEPNLIVGTDRSPEEDRLLYYLSMRTTGNINQYMADQEQAIRTMDSQVNAILNNPKAALQHYDQQKTKHTSGFGGQASNQPFEPFTGAPQAFGGSSAFGSGAFGQKPATAFGGSAFGSAGNNAFGASAFGGGTASAFGGSQPVSAFGATTGAPAFGSTSSLGASAFGKPSALGGGPAFGQASAFGAASNSAPAFGATSALGQSAAPAFGSTSALGSTSTPAFGATSGLGAAAAPAFGATSTLGSGSAFGQTSSLGGNNAFNKSAPSAFGQPSALGQASPFNQSTNTAPGFGSSLSSSTNSTLAAPGFGSANVNPTGFGSFATTNNPSSLSSANMDDPDYKAFASDHFDFRGIPEVEPPAELC